MTNQDEKRDFLCHTSERAPDGCLRWLRPEDGDEDIPSTPGLYYELTFDEDGCVYPTVALRDAENFPIAGAQVGYSDLLEFAQWAFKSGLAQLQLAEPTVDASIYRSYIRDYVTGLVGFIKKQLPDSLTGDIDHEVALAAAEEARREALIEARIEYIAALENLERRLSGHLVQLSRIAVQDSVEDRDARLADPVLQSAIVRAVEVVADGKRTA